MKLLHFTDIHLTTPGQTIADRDPIANFDKALAHAMAHHADAEAIVITGDLSDWGDIADYEHLRDRIAALPLPVHLCIGNHDDRASFLQVFPEAADQNGFVQKTVDLSHGTAILLDSWGPETHAGHFCETRQAWLDARLRETEGPVWIFLHHNPMPTHLGPMDQIMLLDHQAFGDVVGNHRGKIAHIFHGHCHLPLSGSVRGIPVSAPRGTNHAGWANFGEPELLSSSDLPEAYAVILTTPDTVTVHMVEYGYQGEIRTEGTPDYAAWDRAVMQR